MLYDPKWEKPEVKADPFSLESLIAWLEKQNPETQYQWVNASDCLIGQWLASAHGLSGTALSRKSCQLTANLDDESGVTVLGRIAFGGSNPKYTFGAALTRARAALAQQTT